VPPLAPLLALALVTASGGGSGCRVAIDVGHDRASPGATSARGAPEWAFNAALARRLEAALPRRGVPAFLLEREGDAVPPTERPARAAAVRATLLVSIHHDSVQPRYLSTWRFRGRDLAYSDRFRGYGLFVSARNGRFEESERAAGAIADALRAAGLAPSLHHAEAIPGEGRPLLDRARGIYRYDDLAVLAHAPMPAVLVEAAVIVHRGEERRARSPLHQQRVADALAAGVRAYCASAAARGAIAAPPSR